MTVVMQQTKQTVIAHCHLRLERLGLQWQRRVGFELDDCKEN